MSSMSFKDLDSANPDLRIERTELGEIIGVALAYSGKGF